MNRPKPKRRAKHRLPTWDRLAAMRAALYTGEGLNAAMRRDITLALSHLEGLILAQSRRRGPPIDWDLQTQVAIVAELIDHHNATLKEAIYAVLPDGDDIASESLQRAYRRRAGSAAVVIVSPTLVEEAWARLRPPERT